MAGNGVIRAGASNALVAFAERLKVPVATTFMAKGVIPCSHPLSLGAVGLAATDYVSCGFDRADGYFPKINVRGRKFGSHVELSDTFARRNYNRTQAEQIAGVEASVAGAKSAGAEAETLEELGTVIGVEPRRLLLDAGRKADDDILVGDGPGHLLRV